MMISVKTLLKIRVQLRYISQRDFLNFFSFQWRAFFFFSSKCKGSLWYRWSKKGCMSWKRKTSIRVPNNIVNEGKWMAALECFGFWAGGLLFSFFFFLIRSHLPILNQWVYLLEQKIRRTVHGRDPGLNLPINLSPATSECQGTGEEDLISWVISWFPTIFNLENFLSLMCFLYWVTQMDLSPPQVFA